MSCYVEKLPPHNACYQLLTNVASHCFCGCHVTTTITMPNVYIFPSLSSQNNNIPFLSLLLKVIISFGSNIPSCEVSFGSNMANAC